MPEINKKSLISALSNMLGQNVSDAVFDTDILTGGTLGDVYKIYGTATRETESIPFDIVLKIQRKWERHGDPECWRREFEIYRNGLYDAVPDSIKIPKCYFLEEEADTDADADITYMWIEHIDGMTGNEKLHAPELSLSIEKLGFLQAWYNRNGNMNLPYIRSYPAVKSSFDLWYGKMRDTLIQPVSGFPDELRETLNHYASKADELFESLTSLPPTLCHGDVHHDNLFIRKSESGTDVYLIDWDSAGFGYMGEDAVDVLMEAFVYSDRDVSLLPCFKKNIIESYIRGAKSGGVDLTLSEAQIRSIFVLAWGFRIAADIFLCNVHNRSEHEQKRYVDILSGMLK